MGAMMKEALLHMLSENEGEFVSGQEISNKLNCSRTAIWKHISELRNSGYTIEAVQKRGYRLVTSPDLVTAEEVSLYTGNGTFGKKITYKSSVKSTQEIAHSLAREGAPEGSIVLADEQTGGRGRLGRAWQSPAGTGVWMSLILKPNIPLQKAPQLTLLIAVAASKAIEKVAGLEAEIKWPNDILIKGKKTAGILTELQAEADSIHSVIVGIGMNVNQQTEHFSDEIAQIATSLAIEGRQTYKRAEVIGVLLQEIETLYRQYLENGFGVIKLLWEARAFSLGKRITARSVTGSITGYAKGITEEGVLLLEDDRGQVHSIYSADIEIPSP
ncbi:biotin--acetyl-CoA-carboxylase ligase [Fictibacillus phosphorivorans]|uniref:Bifunctional ligase/repressor BirA n=1 Tax=Fictibacillus phosphorivorans TaxID=1221500 RepID=A0A163R5J2_9BACL|nr:biotin--[acetyl-CoA-carboxylase] ligase [Fictibacillus phosphorivorans]KZE66221.1 biotin--acetyl-CoA-carboxylase ligase [Fictibacillus phosphorivorans]